MKNFNREEHWENIYKTKASEDVSWYQSVPETSLQLIKNTELDINAHIIDIGGGDSLLADNLVKLGYKNITVLDISETAIKKVKMRLGKDSDNIRWIISDVTEFNTDKQFDLWHDRAAFHFLTTKEDINKYISVVSKSLKPGGKVIIGTFSEEGPEKCSGINIRRYSEEKLKRLFGDHLKPGGKVIIGTFSEEGPEKCSGINIRRYF